MSETTERVPTLSQRVHALAPGVAALVAEAEETWISREAGGSGDPTEAGEFGAPGWRSFEDAFPTFYQFTNRPPR